MCKEKATRNGNGNSRLAEQLGIIRGKNIGKKTAYLKCHNLMPEVLPELCFWAVPFRRAAFFLCVRIPGTEILRRRKTDGKKRRKSWRKVCCFDKFRLFCNRVKKRPGT